MDIYLIRHTSLAIGHDLCYGQSDVLPADSFKDEYDTLCGKLPPRFDAIFSSPLKRCRLLAESLQGGDVHFDPRLLELNFGSWEMKRWDGIDQAALNLWMDNFVHHKTPGGECFQDLQTRAADFLNGLHNNPFKTIALVTHAGVIRAMIAHILGMPLRNAFQLKLDYGAVSLVTHQENMYNLAYLNK